MSWTNAADSEFYAEFRRKHPWFFPQEEQSTLTEYVAEERQEAET